jgi:hypothetical protein
MAAGSQLTTNRLVSSLYSLGTDRVENTVPTISSIARIRVYQVVAMQWLSSSVIMSHYFRQIILMADGQAECNKIILHLNQIITWHAATSRSLVSVTVY